ncbi:MAG: non-homologous end-joining DNA ligase [Acidimicrobiales bacterium]
MDGSSLATMPRSIAPMLATAGHLPADEAGWAFEFKWDGIRAIAFLQAGQVRFASRNDKDLTGSVPELQPGGALGELSAVLDGEIVALDERGVPRFQLLQNRGRESGPGANRSAGVAYIVFDIVWLAGRSLMGEPYSERRRVLDCLGLGRVQGWMVAPSFSGPGEDVFEASRQRHLEGVVAKRLDSRYSPGRRSSAWVKVKHAKDQEVVIGGWTRGEGSRSGSIGALLLGVNGPEGLAYVGKVGSGFDGRELRMLAARFADLVADGSPFSTPVPAADARVATWLQPSLVGEVSYTEWTDSGRLRQPVWRGLRPDKSPADVVREG